MPFKSKIKYSNPARGILEILQAKVLSAPPMQPVYSLYTPCYEVKSTSWLKLLRQWHWKIKPRNPRTPRTPRTCTKLKRPPSGRGRNSQILELTLQIVTLYCDYFILDYFTKLDESKYTFSHAFQMMVNNF